MNQVRTRIAPSPTGYPHIGTIYQAMFDYVFAKKYEGKFFVRVEDTDRARFVEGAEKVIFESLDWFGLNADEDPNIGGEFGPYRQSERLDIYKKYVDQLIADEHAYYCFCTKERLDEMRKKQEQQHLAPMYDKFCRNLSKEEVEKKLKEGLSHVVRMKIPEDRVIKIHDLILGEVEFKSNLIDDQVILKSDGFPTYHLAVVVDDYLMKTTHVFRGQEWLPSTPKHVLLYEFLGWSESIPVYIHLPVILNSEGGGKLSKRHGHASVDFYKQQGYLPEAILNYLSNIVWNHPDGKEIYPLMDLGRAFHMKSLGDNCEKDYIEIYTQGPKFDLNKLNWVNGEWIRSLSDEELTKRLQEFLGDHPNKEKIAKVVPLIKERIKVLSDFVPLTDFLFEKPDYDKSVFDKFKDLDVEKTLEKIVETLEQMKNPWDAKTFEDSFRKLAEDLNLKTGEMFQLVRIAISGQSVTPPLFESIQIIGEDETLQRAKYIAEKYPDIEDLNKELKFTS